MDINGKKNLVNDKYDAMIKAMEAFSSLNYVHTLAVETAEALADLAKSAPQDRTYVEKAKLMLRLAQEIRATHSYDNVYLTLKGKSLNRPSQEQVPSPAPMMVYQPVEENAEENVPQATKEESSESQFDIDGFIMQNPEDAEPDEEKPSIAPEEKVPASFVFKWDELPSVSFDDVAGLEEVKEKVFKKVIRPLTNPEAYEGYDVKHGGGCLLYGPPGTGKTMIGAAIAREIGAKFCSIKASDILTTGIGNSQAKIAKLFEEAKHFKCAVIFFDEVETLCPGNPKATHAKEIRSEMLAQMQGIESYGKKSDNILFLVAATNKPWDIDPAFMRPGRFDIGIYVGLPDDGARCYMISKVLSSIEEKGVVSIKDDIDYDAIVAATDGFNGADIDALMQEVQTISIERSNLTGDKYISHQDFVDCLERVHSSVLKSDLAKLETWTNENYN